MNAQAHKCAWRHRSTQGTTTRPKRLSELNGCKPCNQHLLPGDQRPQALLIVWAAPVLAVRVQGLVQTVHSKPRQQVRPDRYPAVHCLSNPGKCPVEANNKNTRLAQLRPVQSVLPGEAGASCSSCT